ncbi:MAG: hypothetical protein HYV16_15105 [Gammaproteobacteria bacterium]|nr:hypothetical protein [Gammaproteobacteria bacterium]
MKAFLGKYIVVLLAVNLLGYHLGYWLQWAYIEPYRFRVIMAKYEDLAMKELAVMDSLKPEQWPEAAKAIEKRLDIPTDIDTFSSFEFAEYRDEDLFNNRVVYHGHYLDGLFLDLFLKRGVSYMTWGPLPEPFWFTHLDILVRLAIWVGIIVVTLLALFLPYKRRLDSITDSLRASLADGIAHPLPDSSDDSLGQLSRAYNQTAHAIEQWRHRQSQLLADQRDLMHAIAHELRGPLARADFALEILRDSTAEEQRRKLTDNLSGALSELEELVREVLGYARLQHGATALNPESIDLAELVDTVIAKVKTLYPNIAFQSDATGLQVRADRHLLERATLNLIKNAACYARSAVQVHWQTQDGLFRLSVEDDGPGIPLGQRESVFMPFVRLDPSRSRDSGGVGLGLAIVKTISERHAGKVALDESTLGGARFTLAWPSGLAA